jgi:hypothetical protein
MLKWFKRRAASSAGPDYRQVDTTAKAEELWRRGKLTKLLLVPTAFCGRDIPRNVVYVPAFAAEQKTRVDLDTIKPLVEKGEVGRYRATPEYQGTNIIPSRIRISATGSTNFESIVAIWIDPAQKDVEPKPRSEPLDLPTFTLSSIAVETLGPEDFVRAYISDYERWNSFAFEATQRYPHTGEGMAAAEAAYAKVIEKYCPPGHVHQPVAFGSDSLHDTAQETVLTADVVADGCVVKTRNGKTQGTHVFNSDFEYHLRKADERWFLVSNLYLASDRNLECL